MKPIVSLIAVAAFISVLQPLRAESPEVTRPNILFIFCDDLTCQALSCYGDNRQLLDTPNIDRIAHEGMRFDRCLVTNSICGPSRATILTGKYSHMNGFYNNTNCQFDSEQVTFPKMLQKSGYTTAMIGKWHLVTNPTGFDYWNILPGQGLYYNPPMFTASGRVETDGYVTDVVTDLSLDWLRKRDPSKPFLLMCQHKAPHREWVPAIRHLGWTEDKEFVEPETLFDNYSGRSLAISDHDMGLDRTFEDLDAKLVPTPNMTEVQREEWDAYYEPRNAVFRSANPQGDDLVRWRYQRYMHDYLACVKAVDENVGRILDFLDVEKLTDKTLLVFSSDQGFYLGEHGWFDKRWIFEESLRSPLLVRWPKKIKAGTTNSSIVSLMDFAETFLEVAGEEPDSEMQGRSRAIARRSRVWLNDCNVSLFVNRSVLFSWDLTKERRDADGAGWYYLQTL